MFKRLKTITNKLLALGIIVAVLIVFLVGLDIYQKAKQKEGLSDNNLLQAPKEKIVDYEIKPQGNDSNVVIYHYVSAQEVPAETYQGLKEDLAKRTPNSQTFLKSIIPIDDQTQLEEYVSKFYSSPTFQKEGDIWYQIETATTTPVAFASQTKLTLLDQVKEFLGQKVLADIFFAGSGDGEVSATSDTDWATVHALTSATAGNGVSIFDIYSEFISGGGGTWNIARGFFPFNTSAIPSSAVISSATLDLSIIGKQNEDNDGQDYINIVQTTQPDSTTLGSADFDVCGAVSNPTTGATAIDITDIDTAAHTIFTLNATGLTWIAKSGVTSACGVTTGVTCLGLREGHDLENVSINDAGGDKTNSINVVASEWFSTATDPWLTITYALAAPNILKINGGTVKVNGGTVKVD